MSITHHRETPIGERILARTPAALIEFPLETLLAAWGLILGVPGVLLVASPTSVQAKLDPHVVIAWAAVLTLSAVTIAAGIVRRRWRSVVPRGLWLLGPACMVYAITVVAANGWHGVPVALLLAVIALFCGVRGWWLRYDVTVQLRIREAARW